MIQIDQIGKAWLDRLKKLKIPAYKFCPQVPISPGYFSDLCAGKASNPSLVLMNRIESVLAGMERRADQAQDAPDKRRKAAKAAAGKDRARPRSVRAKNRL